jgi:hypothetical protein
VSHPYVLKDYHDPEWYEGRSIRSYFDDAATFDQAKRVAKAIGAYRTFGFDKNYHAAKAVESGDPLNYLAGLKSPTRRQKEEIKFPLCLIYIDDLYSLFANAREKVLDEETRGANEKMYDAEVTTVIGSWAALDKRAVHAFDRESPRLFQ